MVHETGSIRAEGGTGGGGENTTGFNRVGGGSGGGAGGHIVLSSASFIEVRAESDEAGDFYNDDASSGGSQSSHQPRPISALGGEGGAGKANKGGSRFNGEPQPWRCDAIPYSHFLDPDDIGNTNPPADGDNCFGSFADGDDPGGPVLGCGGDGGPGIIQLHVDDPATNLRFPAVDNGGMLQYGVVGGLDVSKVCAPRAPRVA